MARAQKWGLLLAPGAGASSDAPALVAIEAAMPTNVVVHRMDFPYRKAGRRAPDRQPVLLEALIDEAKAFARSTRIPMKRMFVGGRSMGGRMASIAVAEGLGAAGLVLISYPLHPPGRPDKLRIEHLPAIEVPTLFVSGDRDAFGTPRELRKHAKVIAGPVSMKLLKGGDHGLKRFDAVTADHVRTWIQEHVEQAATASAKSSEKIEEN